MSLTLRQLQRLFSAVERDPNSYRGDGTDGTLGELAKFISGNDRWKRALVDRDGGLVNRCDCRHCKQAGTTLPNVRSHVDRWVREHGPNADLIDVIRDEKAKQQPNQQQQGQSGQDQQGQGQQAQDQQGQGQRGQGQQGQGSPQSSQTQPTGPASGDNGEPENSETQAPPAQPRQAPQPSPEQRALDAAKQELKQALAEAAQQGKRSGETAKVRVAKGKMRQARKRASFNRETQAAGVSLFARQQVARGLGRLQNVPQKLRSQMAELINRLVEQGGTAGENFGPVPVLSATRLVKRMVVRRPLPNALKEDTVAGRPVVLFLPDISPSCAKQAQPACDLANAAGYAGVSGSDVLVLPHFNGEVNSGEEYIPWFNGRPAATDVREADRLFERVCSGESSYRVRVVVMLGDHDAVDRYGSVADLRSVTRVLWLHNLPTRGGRKCWPEPAAGKLLPHWGPEAMSKLSMVVGCVGQPQMLTGFDMALKMKSP